ncbi:MAG: CoB--CoM heterodisulfide reductase iron-sulfur subunit A family protein, partial [Bacteroidota bacterium]
MEEARIGVYVCWCGTNISLMVDVESVSKEIGNLPNVVVSKDYKYMCSDPGQDLIIKDIKENNLNRIVVAACSPRMHELTFRKTLAKAGLNPYFFEMANIREQDSWVHTDRAEATKKAKALIAAAVNRVYFHEALDERTVDIDPATLVIGGGIAGITAALEIADAGKKVFLVEKTEKLGGIVADVDSTFPYLSGANQILFPLISRVKKHSHIELFSESEIKQVFGYIGNFETTVFGKNGKETPLKFGNVIVATGLKPFDPGRIEQYGYGKFPDVVTSLEFEKILNKGNILTKDMAEPKYIAIIHCVGSRNKNYHEYCSRTCCMTALKFANQIRSGLPKAHIFDIYADMRAFGKDAEELYTLSSRRKIKFFMFDQQNELPKIIKSDPHSAGKMTIELEEKLSGKSIAVPADMVVLMVGVEAHDNAKEIAHAVGISMCGNSFYIERHPKLDPVATTTDGVYIVGTCQGPKDIPDSVSQARAAAARVLACIAQGSVHVE